MGRAAAKIGMKELSRRARISTNTLIRLERGDPLKDSTLKAIQTILEDAGVTFIADNGKGPGVRFKPKSAAGKGRDPRR